ncbi:unnamed protein product [Protopolystoma xenopodis]|uniref:Uncharacterized protein n=1 Tax=Protopolystoma xenopodis TaxID=117903 RepID=A0A448X8Y9_9PLAT|nr:unnamed protein product [Protopolystoma xenopodis]
MGQNLLFIPSFSSLGSAMTNVKSGAQMLVASLFCRPSVVSFVLTLLSLITISTVFVGRRMIPT